MTSAAPQAPGDLDFQPRLPSPLESVDDMRATAKWIVGAAAAVGASLLGGASLAAIGKVHGAGSAALAYGGLVLALAGAGWVLWHATEVLIPPATTLGALELPQLAALRAQIAADPSAFYGPFGGSARELRAAFGRFDASAANVAVMLAAELDPARQRILAQGLADATANASQARARLFWVLAIAHAWQVRILLRRARLHAFVGAVVAAFGVVLFITAATPSGSGTSGPAPTVPASRSTNSPGPG